MPLRRFVIVALVLACVATTLAAWEWPSAAGKAHTTRAAAASAPQSPGFRPVPMQAVPLHPAPVHTAPRGGVVQARRTAAQRALADLRDMDRILRGAHLRAGTAAPALHDLTRYVALLRATHSPDAAPARHPRTTATRPAVTPGRRAGTSSAVTAPVGTSRAAIAIRYALAQLGKPYVWGAAGPHAFDCSGLVMRAWGAAGVTLPHYTHAIWHMGTHITRSQLRPGDLVFPYGLGHVQLYIGHGEIVEAPHSGADVRIRPLTAEPTLEEGYLALTMAQ